MQPSPLIYRIPAPPGQEQSNVRFVEVSETQPMGYSQYMGSSTTAPNHKQFHMNYSTGGAPANLKSTARFVEHPSAKRTRESDTKKSAKNAERRRRKKSKQSKWQTFFCLDAKSMPQPSEVFDFSKSCTGSDAKKSKVSRGLSRVSTDYDHIKIYDGSYIPLGFEDDMSNDWDRMKPGMSSTRAGPERKSSTDLHIQVRDLFPCLGDIFDLLGCAKKKKIRARVEQRSAGRHTHPQLETVCLECGHVLDQKSLEKSVMRDAMCTVRGVADYSRLPRAKIPQSERPAAPFDYGYGEITRDWDKESTYSGYKGWRYEDDDMMAGSALEYDQFDESFDDVTYTRRRHQQSSDKPPLPKFQLTETRTFKSRPGGVHRKTVPYKTEYFDVDDTGHIALPRFNKKS